MEIRLSREIEKSKSALHKARNSVALPSMTEGKSSATEDARQNDGLPAQQELSSEQLQLLKQENRELLKHYEDTLDQVRYDNLHILITWNGADETQIYRTVTYGDLGASEYISC